MMKTAKCTLCTKVPSDGFYTGCMIKDGACKSKWVCDGNGNLTTTTAYAWEQLTELVASAMGIPLVWHEALDEYSNLLNGASFDPVRDNQQAATLAKERELVVKVAPGVTVAAFPYDGVEFMIAEYDHYNDGDEMKSFRLAVCRAILQQAEVMKP